MSNRFDFTLGDGGPIEHVFVLMLENRSFDHFFALSGIEGITAARPHDPQFCNRHGGVTFDFQGGAPTEGEEHVYEVELSTFTGRYGPAYVLTAKRDVTDRLGALIPA